MKTSMLVAISAIGMAFAMPALAADKDHMTTQQKVDMKFDKLDTNKDGMISKSEMDAAKMDKLSAADTNKDGMISKAEMTNWKEHKKSM